jgi:hypothetical protein
MTREDAVRRSGRLRSTASRGPDSAPAEEDAATLTATGLDRRSFSSRNTAGLLYFRAQSMAVSPMFEAMDASAP